VTGSLELWLSDWCTQHGLHLIGTRLESRNGVLTGRFLGVECVRQEKARRILESYDLSEFSAVYGYGDSPEDADMLELATRRYFRWQEAGAGLSQRPH
jgi:phosphatidylglycerophosphatase C